ncbi:MAG: cupin domain-containing protein, partial [Actinomycetota bacterium]
MTEDEIFPKAEDIGFRTWGVETLLALVPGKFSFKRLEMKAGTKGGLQYHQLKNEVQILISGKLLIRYDSGTGSLS